MPDSSAVWVGEASRYDQTRPTPPSVLVDILTQLIHTPRPALVVDLGCGTGRSTVVWGERAEQVIGIEPSDDMRRQALRALESHPAAARIAYRAGVARQTGLDSGSADVVTCAQAFHWMDPSATLAEIARILRAGGVFAAYDYGWPPAIRWELDQIFQEVDARFEQAVRTRGAQEPGPRWSKEQHLERMRQSGLFRFTTELVLHQCEYGDADRFMGLVLSSGYSYHLRRGTMTEREIGLERLRQAAIDYIGTEPIPWYFSYHVRIGIR
ncbi:MAG TPA: class I SAM-dependent methyltransferase [Herpetosiphonaceae bacterium]|nr:class I SAM-dependent methyltransferase [Herpetosiphonaceae bacterium]